MDATYKLDWNGYPLVIVGVVDADRHFHPVIFPIVFSEEWPNYVKIFVSLKNERYSPKFIMSDGAESIKKAAKKFFC